MKKIIAVLVAVLLVASAFAFTASADATLTFSPEATISGSTIEVAINVSGITDDVKTQIAATNAFTLTYDSSLVSIPQNGEYVGAKGFKTNYDTEEEVGIAKAEWTCKWAADSVSALYLDDLGGTSPIDEDQAIITFVFTVKDGVTSGTATFNLSLSNGTVVAPDKSNPTTAIDPTSTSVQIGTTPATTAPVVVTTAPVDPTTAPVVVTTAAPGTTVPATTVDPMKNIATLFNALAKNTDGTVKIANLTTTEATALKNFLAAFDALTDAQKTEYKAANKVITDASIKEIREAVNKAFPTTKAATTTAKKDPSTTKANGTGGTSNPNTGVAAPFAVLALAAAAGVVVLKSKKK